MTVALPNYPALAAVPELRRVLGGAGLAVLAAPPGSGKTTTVPLALLDEPWLEGKKILLLEPRRVAARAAAARMARLLGERVGETVGYQIRFERKVSAATRIEVVTEGLLTRRLQADAELPGVGLVIFDEFHERSLDADLALALTLDARSNLNPDLRLLVMSATLDTQRVSALLGGAAVIEATGSLFPVDVRYRGYRTDTAIDEATASAVLTALAETDGDVLTFLPGAREIRQVQRRLEDRVRDVAIYPLYGELSSEQQDAALAADPRGQRKVILATNIAQTSLTVEGVTTVVDAGWVRVARYDVGAGANRLETQRVSRASADQRAGRAGRLGAGTAYRLWNVEQHSRLNAHDTPELLATDLTRFALELATWGITEPSQLAFLDYPPAALWRAAQDLLRALGALDAQGKLSGHGKALARLPTAPRRAHMLHVAQSQGLSGTAAVVAMLLEEQASNSSTDIADTLRALRQNRADPNLARRVREGARQLLRMLSAPDADPMADLKEDALGRLLAWAYPERIARRREGYKDAAKGLGREVAYLTADGGEARLAETDPLAQSQWLAIGHWEPVQPRRIRSAAELDEATVLADHQARIQMLERVYWQPQTEAVVAEQQQCLGQLVLQAKPLREPSAAAKGQIAAALIDGIRSLGLHVLPWTDAARIWQARVQSLRHWQPDAAWPDVSDEALLAELELWLAPYLDGLSRRSHLERIPLLEALNSMLDYPQQQALSRLAPTHLAVPTGNRYALDYTPGQAPALEVKLQEMFGTPNTPTVCDGQVRVTLHLLSPGRKPVAVTGDLASFWAKSYFEVKKDLRGRYPRHPWPDDPLAAQATARAKPRGT